MPECCWDTQRKVLDIVKKHIGFAAIGDDVPEDMPVSFFHQLWEDIWDEATKS